MAEQRSRAEDAYSLMGRQYMDMCLYAMESWNKALFAGWEAANRGLEMWLKSGEYAGEYFSQSIKLMESLYKSYNRRE